MNKFKLMIVLIVLIVLSIVIFSNLSESIILEDTGKIEQLEERYDKPISESYKCCGRVKGISPMNLPTGVRSIK